jgi:hypothetical protein
LVPFVDASYTGSTSSSWRSGGRSFGGAALVSDWKLEHVPDVKGERYHGADSAVRPYRS